MFHQRFLATRSPKGLITGEAEGKDELERRRQRPINQEPERNINPANVASTAPTFEGYRTMREFKADRSNPRYQMEPAFRQAVDQRIMRTDFNNLQA